MVSGCIVISGKKIMYYRESCAQALSVSHSSTPPLGRLAAAYCLAALAKACVIAAEVDAAAWEKA